MSAHTPGPWNTTSLFSRSIAIIGPEGRVVAEVGFNLDKKFNPCLDEQRANAAILSAALELLEALKGMVAQECGDKPITDAERAAVAVIAKVEGRA